jgi:hypothetical protein
MQRLPGNVSGMFCLEGATPSGKYGDGLYHQMICSNKNYIDNAEDVAKLSSPPPGLPDLDDEDGLG